MITIYVVDKKQKKHELICKRGDNLMRVIKNGGISIKASCDGQLSCTTCCCLVDEESFKSISFLNTIEEEELELLERENMEYNCRLACNIRIEETIEGVTFYVHSKS